MSAFLPGSASLDERLYSHNTAEMIDDEVRKITDHSYHRLQSVLRRRLEDLQVVDGALVQQETLSRAEIDAFISEKEAKLSGTSEIEQEVRA
ncbi:MAG: hypothetical protein ACJ74Y_01425 [Bryobacteraceae bacterium]